jgi:hypothetical protein
MRGDSLRDFYAKALALVGLGTLASVGALVDYWPSPVIEIPRVAGLTAKAAGPAVPRAADLPIINTFTPLVAGRPSGARVATVVALTEPVVLSPEVSEALMTAVLGSAPVSPAPVPDAIDVMPIGPLDETAMPGTRVRLSSPPVATVALEDLGQRSLPEPPKPAAASTSDGITGVFRKTGSSLATVGIRTGSTIVGAFRAVGGAVGGAFRKIL